MIKGSRTVQREDPIVRIQAQEPVVLFGFALFYAYVFIRATMLITWFPTSLNRFIVYFDYLVAVAGIVLSRRFKWYELILIAAIGLVGIAVTGISDSNTFFMYFLYIIAFAGIKKERVAKTALTVGLIIMALAVVLSRLGIIEDLVYMQADGTQLRIRQSLGFVYPTDFAAHVFYLLLIIFYLTKGKLTLFTGPLYLVSAWFVKEFNDARLSMAMILLLFAASLFLTLRSRFRIHGIVKWMMIFSFPIGSAITFGMLAAYERGNSLAVKLNGMLSDRLSIGVRLLKQYGVKLLGQSIEQYGNGGTLDDVVQFHGEYSFIDMSFQRILQMYGIIAFIVVMLFSMYAMKRAIDRGAVLLPVILTLVTINSIVDQHYLGFAYNIFLMMMLDHTPKLTIKKVRYFLKRKSRGRWNLWRLREI